MKIISSSKTLSFNKKLWIKKDSNLKNITALCKWNTVNKMKPTRVTPAARPFKARDTGPFS